MKRIMVHSLLFLVLAGISGVRASAASTEVLNFALLDQQGKLHELRRMEGKAVVLFFTANGCPVARLSAPKLKELDAEFEQRGVTFWLVNANSADDRQAIAKETMELRLGHLPVLKDDTQGVARHLGVNRTCECVAIGTKDWTVFYRGAIDDQLVEGSQKPAPTERYLEVALNEFLADKPVTQQKSVARGCLIHFDGGDGPDSAQVSYAKDVAPILTSKCVGCHSAGNIGSWEMADHGKVKSMATMIEEVILARRMPPWDSDPHIGKFESDASLKLAEAQTLLRWVHQGAPRGDGLDPLATNTIKPADDWPLGKPDIILRLPQPEQIPASGVVDYRHIEVAAGNAEQGWIGGVWVKPGNRQVVHHVLGVLKDEDEAKQDPNDRQIFAAYAPGSTQGWLPKGTGLFLPKNARFNIQMHYTPNGVATTDQTEIGLYLMAGQPQPLKTVWIFDPKLKILPGDSEAEHHAIYGFKQEATLYSIMPHMHLRGRWMKFELLRPDGKRETLLSVPRYDFNWQRTYTLEKPRKIPAGSWVLITGGYDNSPRNPANPDPKKIIRWGDQSFDEMFIGLLSVTWNDGSLQ